MCAGLSSCVLEYKKTAYHRKRATLEAREYLGGKALRCRLEFAIVVVPEFASVVEFGPHTFRAQALSVESVSEQAAYTPLPIARMIRGEQLLKRRHFCWFLKLQETWDFDFNVHSIIGIGLKI
jgi:hypothetical protein